MVKKISLNFLLLILISLTACEITASGDEEIPAITRENASSLTLYTTFGETGNDDLAWSPDGSTLAVASQRGIYLVDLETQEMQRISTDFAQFSPNDHIIAFSPDGILLAFSDNSLNSPGKIRIYDIKSQERLFDLDDVEDPEMQTFGIAFSPDGSMLAAGCGTLNWGFGPGSVKIWEVSTGTLIHEFGHDSLGTIYNLAFNPNGSQLAAISSDGHVYSWDLETHQLIQVTQALGGIGYGLAFSPDGKILAVASSLSMMDETTTLRLINLSSGETTLKLQVPAAWSDYSNEGGSIAFNSDGSLLASTCQDDTVRLWDSLTGEQLTVMDVPGAHSVSFSPDGTLLATAGHADILRLWGTRETAANVKESSTPSTFEAAPAGSSTIQALAVGEDFQPGRWSLDGRFVYYSDQGPLDEPGPDQAYSTLTFLDTQTGETLTSVQEILTFSYNPWSETKIPDGPFIDRRGFWMNDNRLLYLSPDGDLIILTPWSDSIEDWTKFLPESVTAFHSSTNIDQSQLLLKGESSTWLFSPSTRQSVKVAIPKSYPDEENRFAWSPWEMKLVSSRVEEREGFFGIILENINPLTGTAETIAEFPVKNEGYGWGHSISPSISWIAKDQLFLHYWDNRLEQEKLIDLSSQPVRISDVFTDLFGIDPPSIDPGISFFGKAYTTGGDDYTLAFGTGLSPDGQLYLYHAKSGRVALYPLEPPKLLVFPDGDIVIGESYDEISVMPLQIIQIGMDRPPYDLEIKGEIPGQHFMGKAITVGKDHHLLVASDQGISLVDVTNGETLRFWVLENQTLYQDFFLSPSPDGRTVMVYAKQVDEKGNWWSAHRRAIYLLHVDD